MRAKKALRKAVFKMRDSLDLRERKERSRAAEEKFFSLPEVVEASTMLFFVSFRSEIHTSGMIQRSLSMGKRVAAPRTDAKAKKLLLSPIANPAEELVPGYQGIPEPRAGSPLLSPGEIDLVVVPGAAFDRRGGRMGYGGGYYDRLLRELRPDAFTVALAFSFQIVEEVPKDPQWDMPVQIVVTDEEVIRCR